MEAVFREIFLLPVIENRLPVDYIVTIVLFCIYLNNCELMGIIVELFVRQLLTAEHAAGSTNPPRSFWGI
jgi:hypothetical protein